MNSYGRLFWQQMTTQMDGWLIEKYMVRNKNNEILLKTDSMEWKSNPHRECSRETP